MKAIDEVTTIKSESKYTYANGVIQDLQNQIHKVKGFENVKESDIINAGLVFLNLFFNIHIKEDHIEENKSEVQKLAIDKEEFQCFLKLGISHSKMHNIMLNDKIVFAGDTYD